MDECISRLNQMLPDLEKNKIKQMSEFEFASSEHFKSGRWMRNNRGLWRKSLLSQYFIDLGIGDPDEISNEILKAFYKSLNNK